MTTIFDPFLEDIGVRYSTEGEFNPSKQPNIEMWLPLYEICWEEHRSLPHANCTACKILKDLPADLRTLPFTVSHLDEISKTHPSFDEVPDILLEREG